LNSLINLTNRQIKGIVIMLQTFLIGSLFLPVGTTIGSNDSEKVSLSVYQLIYRYAGLGFSDDALIYIVLACVFPGIVIFSILFLKERKNFGISVIICALYASASACFYSSARCKMVDYASMNVFPYLIILISLSSMMLLILGFFNAQSVQNASKSNKRDKK